MKKKMFIILLIATVFMGSMTAGPGSGAGEKHLDLFRRIAGDYELYYPLGTKRIFYIRYFVNDGKLFTRQLGKRGAEELVADGSNSMFFKSTKDGMIHQFIKGGSGAIDTLIVDTGKMKIKGIKLPGIIEPAPAGKYSAEALKDDFQQMIRVMKYLHPSMYDYTSKEKFDELIKKALSKITGPVAINDFFAIAAPLVSKMGCAHSRLEPPASYISSKRARLFPLAVHPLKDRLYITAGFNEAYSFLKGAQLIAINGTPIGQITERICNSISSDWNNPLFKNYLLGVSFSSYYYFLYGSRETFDIHFKIPGSGKTQVLEVTAVSKEDISTAKKRIRKHPIYPSKAYSLTFLKNNRVAVLTFKHFNFYSKSEAEKFFKFLDRSFLEIHQRESKNLLIDIRGNMGGSPFCTSYLLSYLIDKPFQYFITGRSNDGYSKFFKLQDPREKSFKGKVITLMDNGCLSSTGHFISLLKHHNIGKLAGSKTGCTFSCTHGESRIYLRNTGMCLKMSKERFTTPAKGLKIDEGINPDYNIELTLKDLLDPGDLQLEETLRLFPGK